MLKNARGVLCAPITMSRARELELDPQVQVNTSVLGTPFTVTVDKLEGCSTGVSIQDRCATIRALADPQATPATLDYGYMFQPVALLAERDGAEMAVGRRQIHLHTLLYETFGACAVGRQIGYAYKSGSQGRRARLRGGCPDSTGHRCAENAPDEQ